MKSLPARQTARRRPVSLLADLSLDLDNQWSYHKTHGDECWSSYPSYLPLLIPHVLRILAEHHLKITVFVVGQDAMIESNQAALREFAIQGHEIGNHSFQHEPWLQRYSIDQLEQEFDLAEQAIGNITSQKLRGFRGPGYCLSADILDLLARRGYTYDGSTLPTFIGPLARAYYFFRANLNKQQADDRQNLFGSLRDGCRPLRPYRWQTDNGPILEIPVTTMPLVRAPFHFSYLLYLAQYSERLAVYYFRWSLWLCKRFRLGPSLLLHPLDFLGGDEVQGLDFFPAMQMPGKQKRDFVSRMLGIYATHFDVRCMGDRANQLLDTTRDQNQPALRQFSTRKV